MKEIKFKWLNWLHIFVTAVLGIGISVGSIYVASLIDEGPFFLKLFPLPFFLAGLFMLYFSFALFLNTTTISKSGVDILVETRPLYWHKPTSVSIATIQRLKVMSSRKADEQLTFSYQINAEMADGTEQVLVPSSIPIERKIGLQLKDDIEMMLLSS